MDVEVVVEIPQGSRNKYEMDHKTGRIRLDRMLFTSTRYPTFPGCLVTARPVAVFWMLDEHLPDAKVLTVSANDLRMSAIRELEDVPTYLAAEIGHFFNIYKQLEPGKSSDVRGWQGRAAAEQVVEEAQSRAR